MSISDGEEGSSDDDLVAADPFLAQLRRVRALQIDGYRALREVARGGQGVVHAAIDLASGHPVAIKTLLHGLDADGPARGRFEREARALSQLRHENVARLLSAGFSERHGPFLVLDWIEGVPLQDVLADPRTRAQIEEGPGPWLDLFVKLCGAIDAVHSVNVIHRDLTPANILVRGAEPMIVDFGLSLFEDPFSKRATVTGQFVGSMIYASPEQVAGDVDIDRRSDVYSLGVILYELLTGARPYSDQSSTWESLTNIVLATPAPFASVGGQAGRAVRVRRDPQRRRLDRLLERVVHRAMAKRPHDRYQSARLLADDVKRCMAGRQPIARRIPLRRTLRRAGWVAIVAVLFVAAYFFMAGRLTPPTPIPLENVAASVPAGVSPYPIADGTEWPIVLHGAPTPIGRLAIAPHNYLLRACVRDNGDGVTVWDLRTREKLSQSAIGSAWDVWSPDGMWVYTPGWLLHAEAGMRHELHGVPPRARCQFSHDGSVAAIVGVWDPRMLVVDTKTGKTLLDELFPYGPIAQFDLSEDGARVVASGGKPRTGLSLWSIESGQRTDSPWSGGAQTWVQFDHEGSRFCALHASGGRMGLFDASTGARQGSHSLRLPAGSRRSRMFSAPQGLRVLWELEEENALVIYDVDGQLAPVRLALKGALTTLPALSSDGRYVATAAANDGQVCLWNATTGALVAGLQSSAAPIVFLAFSPDSALIAVASEGGSVWVWPTSASQSQTPSGTR